MDTRTLYPVSPDSTSIGLTRLEYFAINAPQEPQPWFSPVVAPNVVNRPKLEDWKELPEQTIKDLRGWANDPCYDYKDRDDREVTESELQYVAALENYWTAAKGWDEEYKKQRLIQWPCAWAVEMERECDRIQAERVKGSV